MRLAKEYSNKSQSKRDLANRFVLSSIIHAFSGLESVVNFLGFELFSNEDSSRFIFLQEDSSSRTQREWNIQCC